MTSRYDTLIAGAGIFGIATALELNARGHAVAVLDPGPLPRPLAASTDISKVVRVEYGPDDEYMTLAEQARAGWLSWNAEFDDELYHETGIAMLTRQPMTPGSFVYESYRRLLERGYKLDRLDSTKIAERMPAWNAEVYTDGYFNEIGGYAESGRVMEVLIEKASREGVTIKPGQTVNRLIEEDGRVVGVTTIENERFEAEQVVIAAGAWTPVLLPELAAVMRPIGQPIFHLKPADATLFEPPQFSVFSADVANTGWYGFPMHPRAMVIKLARHGEGKPMHPSADERMLNEADAFELRTFLAETFPVLAKAPIVHAQRCLYCDTLDEHFWINRDPNHAGLTVAAGGSGHAFKFGPVLGQLVADAVEAKPNPFLEKFRWRELTVDTVASEATRYRPSGRP